MGVLAGGLAGLWLIFQPYAQLLILAGVFGLSTLGAAVYPVFYRKGRSIAGAYVALAALLLVPVFSIFLVPDLMLAAVWMFAAILLLATLFLGRDGCLRFTIAVVCLEVASLSLTQVVSPGVFPPLNDTVDLIAMLLAGLILPPLVALIIYRNIAEQEKYYRQSKRANREIEQRVAAERAQQHLLQQANQKLDRRALQLQAAAEVSRATRSMLDQIEEFVNKRTSPFVRVRALNPRYQPFRVTGSVRFVKGKSENF